MYRRKCPPFFEKPVFSVIKSGIQDDIKYPKVKIDIGMIDVIPLKLARAGYFGGDYLKILNTPVDVIMNIWNYDIFCYEYEKELNIINLQKDN